MMRSYDGDKICELVGLNLNQLSTVNDKSSVGLYRDNGLTAVNNAMVQSLIELGKMLLHYSRKKDFQSSSK